MDLEIADYERTIRTLNHTVDEKETEIKTLEEEVTRLQERIDSMQKQIGRLRGWIRGVFMLRV